MNFSKKTGGTVFFLSFFFLWNIAMAQAEDTIHQLGFGMDAPIEDVPYDYGLFLSYGYRFKPNHSISLILKHHIRSPDDNPHSHLKLNDSYELASSYQYSIKKYPALFIGTGVSMGSSKMDYRYQQSLRPTPVWDYTQTVAATEVRYHSSAIAQTVSGFVEAGWYPGRSSKVEHPKIIDFISFKIQHQKIIYLNDTYQSKKNPFKNSREFLKDQWVLPDQFNRLVMLIEVPF